MKFKPGLRISLYAVGALLFLAYLMWRADVIPEAFNPIIGYLDDSIVAVVIYIIIRKLITHFKLEGKK